MDKQQEQSASAAAAASTNVAGADPQQEKQTPQLHDHAQVLQEAASALRSLHDGESSDGNDSPAGSKRSSAVAPKGAKAVNISSSTTTGGALQAAVEAAFASKKNKATSGDGSSDADRGGSGNPKKRKQIDGPSTTTDTAANTTSAQFDEEIPLTFPQRLMELLDDEGNDDIIGWLPHGRGFLIYQKRRFASELMGKYFKQSKFTSFTRKLNRWGFTRISRGPETGAYYHPYFRKGNARLCLQMTCQTLNKSGPSGTGTGAGGTGTEVSVASNTAPPPMLQHQEASTAGAQLAVPKASQMQQSLQQQQKQQPIAPAPGLPNPSPMAATLLPNTTAAAGPSSSAAAELLRTETAAESVLRLRKLQRQQEQLMIRQRQIREEIQAISAALPEKIAQERRQQQVMAAAASSTAAGQAGQTMASATTPNAAPATQPTPPSGSTGTGTGTAPATTQGQDPAYSKAMVDAAIESLKRSNANSYLTLLMARQAAKQAGAVSGPIAPAPAMATPAAATIPATAAAASTQPASFQSQLRQTVRAQLDQMRLAQQAQQAQQMKQTMEGITLTDDGRLKAGPGALHPAQAAAQSGTYRSGSQGQKRPSGAKRASAA